MQPEKIIYFFSFKVFHWQFVALSLDNKLCGLIMPDFKNKTFLQIESSLCVRHLKRHLGQVVLKRGFSPLKKLCQRELRLYFEGQKKQFFVPLIMVGTEYQKKDWEVFFTIPYGQIKTYSQLAAYLGNSRSSRAVAAACKANPLPIFIPCHRVIGKQGLTGYSSVLKWKQYLLD